MTSVAVSDLSASVNTRLDRNQNPCGLVKVQLVGAGATFEGNVVGDVAYKNNEYWVYMNQGAYLLNISHPNFLPMEINLRNYGLADGIRQKTTYKLVLAELRSPDVPQQTLIINYSPAHAIVIVDSKTYQGNGRVELTLPIGSHDYQIVAGGYGAAEGTVKLNSESPRTITETLHRNGEPAVRQTLLATPDAGKKEVETFKVGGISFKMVHVEGGSFQMGCRDTTAFSDERPVHQVTLSSYYIGETEVTQELWHAVMGKNRSNFNGINLPVDKVSWKSCQEFIDALNEKTGKNFRLPTEAEWEYAARGGNRSKGYLFSGSNNIDDVAWYRINSDGRTHPVKQKKPNELGLYDMTGNVWEWCQDRYDGYDESVQENPIGSLQGSRRVYRGGSYDDDKKDCRLTRREKESVRERENFFGLRLAL